MVVIFVANRITASDITDTTMRGLGIGVLAGVSGNIIKNVNRLYPSKRKRRKKKRKR